MKKSHIILIANLVLAVNLSFSQDYEELSIAKKLKFTGNNPNIEVDGGVLNFNIKNYDGIHQQTISLSPYLTSFYDGSTGFPKLNIYNSFIWIRDDVFFHSGPVVRNYFPLSDLSKGHFSIYGREDYFVFDARPDIQNSDADTGLRFKTYRADSSFYEEPTIDRFLIDTDGFTFKDADEKQVFKIPDALGDAAVLSKELRTEALISENLRLERSAFSAPHPSGTGTSNLDSKILFITAGHHDIPGHNATIAYGGDEQFNDAGLIFAKISNSSPDITNDNTVMFLSKEENVGIGTAAPSSKLNIRGLGENMVSIQTEDNTQNTGLAFQNSGGYYTSAIYRSNRGGSNADLVFAAGTVNQNISDIPERMRISREGNIGIGTTAPTKKLDVNGGVRLRNLPAGEASDEIVTVDSNGNLKKRPLANIDGSSDGDAWGVNGEDSTSNIGRTGNVGIGTTSPTYKLQVGATAGGDASDALINGIRVGRGSGDVQSNTVLGNSALGGNTTGFRQTAIGYQALRFNTTGRDNTAVGVATLRNNTEGDFNAAIGTFALEDNTTGSHNVALGQSALRRNKTGSYNMAVGSGALINNKGNNNTALGGYALAANTVGQRNVGIGQVALQANTTGSDNVAIGARAGRYFTGNANNTNPNQSIFIGVETKAQADNQTNQIVIGHDAQGIGSNTVVLGNDAVVTTALKGDVGIGTPAPSSKLNIRGLGKNMVSIQTEDNTQNTGLAFQNSGNAYTSAIYRTNRGGNNADLVFAAGTVNQNISDIPERMRISREGNIGIGTASPTKKLDVNGGVRLRTLPAGEVSDEVVTTDVNGNLRKIPVSAIGGGQGGSLIEENNFIDITDDEGGLILSHSHIPNTVVAGANFASESLSSQNEAEEILQSKIKLVEGNIHLITGNEEFEGATMRIKSQGDFEMYLGENIAPTYGYVFRGKDKKKFVYFQGDNKSVGIGNMPLSDSYNLTSVLDVYGAERRGTTHPGYVEGMYVTGDFDPDKGIEFRHSNATQGIGFGYNTIYATGSNANQDINLKAKGTGAVNLLGLAAKINLVEGDIHLNTGYEEFEGASMRIKTEGDFEMYLGENIAPNYGYIFRGKDKKRFVYFQGDNKSVGIGNMPLSDALDLNSVLDVHGAVRTGTHPRNVEGMYVTGDFDPDKGIEFRHSNASQGIGFGYNTIYAAGSNENQDINLKAKGTGAVNLLGLAAKINLVEGDIHLNTGYEEFDGATMEIKYEGDFVMSLGENIDPHYGYIFRGKDKKRFVYFQGDNKSVGIGNMPLSDALDLNSVLDVYGAVRTGTHPRNVEGMYVTGDFDPDKGIEFRHSNASQGIGFGYNTIYATGSNENQDLNLKARGTGVVKILGDAQMTGKFHDSSGATGSLGQTLQADSDGKPVWGWGGAQSNVDLVVRNSLSVTSNSVIIPELEALDVNNITLHNAEQYHGPSSNLFNGKAEEYVHSTHIKPIDPEMDWGIGYTFSKVYFISELKVQNRAECCFFRAGGGFFRVFKEGVLVYTSPKINTPNMGSAYSDVVYPNVEGDEVQYIFNTNEHIFNASEIVMIGSDVQGNNPKNSLFLVSDDEIDMQVDKVIINHGRTDTNPTTLSINADWAVPDAVLNVAGLVYIAKKEQRSQSQASINALVNDDYKDAFGVFSERPLIAPDYAFSNPENWADYVFDENYDLIALEEEEEFIKNHGHLPGFPSAKEVQDKGHYSNNELNMNLLRKVEELTLHVIELNKQIKELKANSSSLKNN